MKPSCLLAFAAVLLATPAVPAAEKTALAVLNLADKGVGTELIQNLTDVVTGALSELGVFQVLSRADIQQMVEFEQSKQLLGCDSDTSCLAELGGALGVALLVNGSVGKVGGTYIINLTLTDTSAAKVLAREQRQVQSEAELTAELQALAKFLVRDLLNKRQGALILKASEAGADVELDGKIIGVTPLGRQTIPGGPHRVRVIKKGFVSWTRDIAIDTQEPLVLDAALVPSLEFINDYDERASTWRVLAYITGGTGLAAVGTGLYLYYGYNAGRAQAYNDEVAAAGCSADATGTPRGDCQAQFAARRTSIERVDLVSIVTAVVGTISLGVGTYLFLQGPTPGLYDQYKPEAAVQVGLRPHPGGLGLAASLGF